jgi:hypothetical protein
MTDPQLDHVIHQQTVGLLADTYGLLLVGLLIMTRAGVRFPEAARRSGPVHCGMDGA